MVSRNCTVSEIESRGKRSDTAAALHIADGTGGVRPQACWLRLTMTLRSLTGAIFVRPTPGALALAEVASDDTISASK